MNFEKAMFAFFIVLALTLNFGFFIGDIDNPAHHDGLELAGALAVSVLLSIGVVFSGMVSAKILGVELFPDTEPNRAFVEIKSPEGCTSHPNDLTTSTVPASTLEI